MDEVLFLVGPTASGKTAAALELALLMPVEVVSLDSMSVYHGMDIGTGKPTPAEREMVPHHLIDIVPPNESFSVGRYAAEAEKLIPQIRQRKNTPFFVGGSPLYLKVLTSGLFSGPPADWEFRGRLHERAEREGTAVLHEELRRVDAVAAGRIHPNDLKRIVRALEVVHETGQPISELQTEWSSPRSDRRFIVAGISRDRQELYRRIETRVDGMFAAGLVDEVRRLLETYGSLSRQASQALGYKEVLAYLAGRIDLERTVELVKRNTRRMAKRQLTWFRSFENIRWFRTAPGTSAAEVARELAEYLAAELEHRSSGHNAGDRTSRNGVSRTAQSKG
ncbi:MAG: hypothetical protein AMS16_02340 [Planctomycetes bacterium DG_58]|nr:MAG: hypothetical protein AMS16_02340 [Planctomycetes bacterium DG_58]KPK97500.1 MAG: hypothetical protein AMK75_07515 [Planctomycetes bacterium SM23_65]